jgi:maltooligosyltrehalose synthase
LQKKLFAHGINWVSDGAFVNEGLQGVHFQHVLKWGEDSPFYNWFNGQSLDGKTWNLGIFPKDSKNMSHKLVNPPILYTQNSSGEIDFIIQFQDQIIPIEVKSAENLQAKSLKAFHQKYNNRYSIRTSLSDFRIDGWLTNIPLYSICQMKFFLLSQQESNQEESK